MTLQSSTNRRLPSRTWTQRSMAARIRLTKPLRRSITGDGFCSSAAELLLCKANNSRKLYSIAPYGRSACAAVAEPRTANTSDKKRAFYQGHRNRFWGGPIQQKFPVPEDSYIAPTRNEVSRLPKPHFPRLRDPRLRVTSRVLEQIPDFRCSPSRSL